MTAPDVATPIKTMCPRCHTMIQVPNTIKLQEVITCQKCKNSFEILSKIPMTLGPVATPKEYRSGGLFKR
jgi:uncharacterized protein YbaR (Trm112 family)